MIATYSIVACDLEAQQWGVSVLSKFLAVGSVVPWAEPHVGSVATQAYANPRYGPQGLQLLREGLPAQDVVERLTAADDGRDHRQDRSPIPAPATGLAHAHHAPLPGRHRRPRLSVRRAICQTAARPIARNSPTTAAMLPIAWRRPAA